MPMNKIQDVKLETTANYQPLSDLNVRFWNQDKNTAELRFIITRNNYPLALSEENVKVFIALEAGDSFLVDDNLDYVDELNGVVAYTIPNEFMRVAKNVVGQVYVTTLDEEEVVVQRQFTFTVANDLIADLPAEDKIREIKYFSDMRAEVAQMMEKLNNDFANMNDYVTQVKQTTEDGIESLTTMIDLKEKAYNDNHIAKMKELSDKAREYSSKFDDDKQYMDDKHQAFKESVLNSEVVTQGESEEWQKYKLTNDNGDRIRVSDIDPVNLDSGFYQMWRVKNAPVGNDSAVSYWNIDVTTAFNDVKQIKAVLSYTGQVFQKNIHKGNDSGWKEIVSLPQDEEIETKNSAESRANETLADANQYTDEQFSKQHTVLFEGSVNGVGQTINMTESMFNYNLIIVSGSTLAGDFDRPVLVNQNSGDYIMINIVNLVDSNGDLGSVYELKLAKTNETTLTIANDVFFDYGTNTGIGPNANRFTIKRIEGWK